MKALIRAKRVSRTTGVRCCNKKSDAPALIPLSSLVAQVTANSIKEPNNKPAFLAGCLFGTNFHPARTGTSPSVCFLSHGNRFLRLPVRFQHPGVRFLPFELGFSSPGFVSCVRVFVSCHSDFVSRLSRTVSRVSPCVFSQPGSLFRPSASFSAFCPCF